MTKGIYKIENIWDGKVYIGESNNIEERWKTHKEDLNNNKHHSYKLQEAWNKDGEISFVFEIIKELDDNLNFIALQDLLLVYEDMYIKQYNSINDGYNIENTLELIFNDKKLIVGTKKVTNKHKAILRNYMRNIEKNNGEYIPFINLKKEITLTDKDIANIVNRYKNYEFKQDFMEMSEVFQDNGINIGKTYKLLRDINVLDHQNKCLINDDTMFKSYKHTSVNKETNEISYVYHIIHITKKGFKYLLHKILTEYKNNNTMVFTQKFIKQIKSNKLLKV